MKSILFTFLCCALSSPFLFAASVTVINHSFEDTTGQNVSNEFTLGVPTGWEVYDPNDLDPSPGLFFGTLEPNGVDFFNTTAPDGDKVAILYNESRIGDGEYGYFQLLGETLAANTSYNLQVEVGNIASGTDQNGRFYNLDEFTGYRVEIMVGTSQADAIVLAGDSSGLTINEGAFENSSITFNTGASHARFGQNLAIRLVSENSAQADPTIINEVDFDNVRFTATPVPEPQSLVLLSLGTAFLCLNRKRKQC